MARAVPGPGGCLLLTPEYPGQEVETVYVSGYGRAAVARIIWANNFGTVGLSTHEVIHIPECPNTGWWRRGVRLPFCIEPSHLALGHNIERCQHSHERVRAYEGGR